MATSLVPVLLAFTMSANLGLFSVDNGIISQAYTTPVDDLPSIVCDSGDGFATIGGAGDLFCDKVNGCVRQDVVIPVSANVTGNGVVLLGGQDLEFGGQELEFTEVSGMGMDTLTGAVRAGLEGEAFDLFPSVATGVACGAVTEDELDEAGLAVNHTIKSPRDSVSGSALGFRLGDRGDVGWSVTPHTIGSTAGQAGADTFAVCAAWDDAALTGYAVVALRNGGSVESQPNRVTGLAWATFPN